jgi:hypothetical protein
MTVFKNIGYIVPVFLLSLSFKSSDSLKWKTQKGEVSFFSSAPIEDIDAVSSRLVGIIDPETNRYAFAVAINSFEFKNKLMQKHFNEDYMESEKYPKAQFIGKMSKPLFAAKDTSYSVTVPGKLTIHGVEKERNIEVLITVAGSKLNVKSDFSVSLEDHNIKIPKMFVKNIAEVIAVKINSNLELK